MIEHDHGRVFRYVERFFAKKLRTEWPTVRQVARAFRWTQQRVSDAVDGDPDQRVFLTSYFTDDASLGDHFVESYGET